MKRLCAILVMVILAPILVPFVWAQGSTSPDWPPEWFGDHLGFPPIPSGTYPVTVSYPGIGGSTTSTTMAVGSAAGPGGYLTIDGTDYGVFGANVTCGDAACETLAIQVVTCSPTGDVYYFIIYLRWSDYVLTVATPTPPVTITPGTSTPVPPTPAITPTPDTTTCPAATISQQPPRAETTRIFPPNPVVVTQGGQGLQVSVRVTSYPVVRIYWEKVDNSHWGCVHVESGFEDDGRYGVSPCAAGWEGWEVRWIEDVKCERRTQIIPDPIVASALRVHARLRESSKRWIEGELRQRYPGAKVRRPNWDEVGQVTVNGCRADGVCILEATVRFMFVDPGYYDMWIDGMTVGTAYTPPRAYRYDWPRPQPVYLMDSTLIW